MKKTDIVYATPSQVKVVPHFDLMSHPRRCPWYLLPVEWLLALPEAIHIVRKIHKVNMEQFKSPYLILGNHNSFFDFKVLTKAIFPHPSTYVVAIDGFIGLEKLMRKVGCFDKRKFVNDIVLVRHIAYSLKKLGVNCTIYPEARYSLVGTTAILPESLGKMIKMLKMPVVTLITNGNHLRQPLWNQSHKRKLKTEATMTGLFSLEQIEKMSVDEINAKLKEAFFYDDFAYQKANKISITDPHRAEGLEHVLYRCPTCGAEFMMESDHDRLWCNHCHKEYIMSEYGELLAVDGANTFTHIPDWYEWEREMVRQEIIKGKYYIDIPVVIDSLPSANGFYRFGEGMLTHGEDGFVLSGNFRGEPFVFRRRVADNYSVHIEYNYANKGNFVSISDNDDTYYLFPQVTPDIVTKIHFAVEELHKIYQVQEKTDEK